MARALVAVAAFGLLAMAHMPQAMLAGGTQASEVDGVVLDAANFVLTSANHDKCSGLCAGLGDQLTLVKVVSATKQVVAGVNIGMQLLVTDASGKQSVVTATVWSRPWLEAKNDLAHPAKQLTQVSYKHVDGTEA